VFFYGDSSSKLGASASLFDAYDLIHDIVGARMLNQVLPLLILTPVLAAATFFAIALLFSGQVRFQSYKALALFLI